MTLSVRTFSKTSHQSQSFVTFCDNYVLLENWNWDTWVGNEENQDDYEDKEGYAGEEDYEPNCEDPDFIVRPFVFLNVQYWCSTELLCSL